MHSNNLCVSLHHRNKHLEIMAQTKEEIAARKRAYLEANRDKVAAQRKASHEKHKDARNAKSREWHANNKEAVLKYRKDNADKIAQHKRNDRVRNAPRVKGYMTNYYQENKDAITSQTKRNYEVNREAKLLRAKERQNWLVSSADDKYIAALLKTQGFPKEVITPELIELKRITLKTERLCRQLKN